MIYLANVVGLGYEDFLLFSCSFGDEFEENPSCFYLGKAR